jgi:hypothetical protein
MKWRPRRAKVTIEVTIPFVLVEDIFKPKGTCWHLMPDWSECGQPTDGMLCLEHTPLEHRHE